MNNKVSDLTVNELKDLISGIINEIMEDLEDDIKSLLDKEYIKSIQEAREDYKKGRVTDIDHILNV
jgi:dGTP triphosphohydrolase